MTREELYQAVTAALVQHKHTDFTDAVTVVIDVVEPLIRADERADLRARVEALPIWEDSQGWKVMSYLDVVALLDGGSDE